MFKRNLLVLFFLGVIGSLHAQFISNQSIEMDHDHYSIESVGEDVIMAGTVYPIGSLTNTDIHVQKMDQSGSVIWEKFHDIGSDERCLDMSLQGEDYILLTGSNLVNGKHKIFVMRLNQSDGSFVDLVELEHDPNTIYTEQFAHDILYSRDRDKYFLVGYASENPLYPGGNAALSNETCLLISLNNDLTFNWSYEINTPTSATLQSRNEFLSITEIPGVGIVVNGRITSVSDPINGAFCYDYSGSLIWSTSHTIQGNNIHNIHPSKAGYFDATNDKYYYVENQRFEGPSLVEVSQASTPGAFISRIANYPDLEDVHNLDCRISFIDVHPQSNTMTLAGYSSLVGCGYPLNARDFRNIVLQVDLSSLSVTNVNQIRAYNPGLRNHDHYHYSLEDYRDNVRDRITRWNDGYALANYQFSSTSGANGVLDLTVTQTDMIGKTNMECEEEFSTQTEFPAFTMTGVQDPTDRQYDVHFKLSDSYESPHLISYGCPQELSCNINITGITRTLIGCYYYSHTVNYTAGPGTYAYQYYWDWGDGNSSTTTVPTANHNYGINPAECQYNVCVTVYARGADGTLCQQTYCSNERMVNFGLPNCESCGPPPTPKQPLSDGSDFSLQAEISFAPNPASPMVTFFGFGEQTHVSVFDMSGKKVLSVDLDGSHELDISTLSPGYYNLVASDNEEHVLREKLIINR